MKKLAACLLACLCAGFASAEVVAAWSLGGGTTTEPGWTNFVFTGADGTPGTNTINGIKLTVNSMRNRPWGFDNGILINSTPVLEGDSVIFDSGNQGSGYVLSGLTDDQLYRLQYIGSIQTADTGGAARNMYITDSITTTTNWLFSEAQPGNARAYATGYSDYTIFTADATGMLTLTIVSDAGSKTAINGLVIEEFIMPKDLTPPELDAEAGDLQVALDWADDLLTSLLASYTLERSVGDTNSFSVLASNLVESAYTDTNVVNGTTYYYRAQAVDTNGTPSAYGSTVSAKPDIPALTPPVLSATAHNAQVVLDWADDPLTSLLASYTLYRSVGDTNSFSVLASNLTASAYNDDPLTNGVTFYYKAQTVHTNGTSTAFGNTVSAAPAGPSPDLGGLVSYEYAGIGGELQTIDVYSPTNHVATDTVPCFVFFHGGGWKNGTRTQGTNYCEYLAGRGMVAMTADYTLSPPSDFTPPESPKRDAVMDAKTVIRWVKANAGTLGINPEMIATGGISAGGHIGVLQMFDENVTNPTDNTNISTDVQGFILMTAAFTLLENDSTPEVNVFDHIDKDWPPTLFFAGETDSWGNASRSLATNLINRGQTVEYWMGLGEGHIFITKESALRPTYLRMDAFLRSLGFLEEQPTLELQPGDIDLSFIYWGDAAINVFRNFEINPAGSGEIALSFARPVERAPLEYKVEAAESLLDSNWIEISPPSATNSPGDGMEYLTVQDTLQTAFNAGLSDTNGLFFRFVIDRDPSVAVPHP